MFTCVLGKLVCRCSYIRLFKCLVPDICVSRLLQDFYLFSRKLKMKFIRYGVK